jgi:hypothetical protein
MRRRVSMKRESCPELYTCSRVKMTPMIRVLLRCTAAEAMDSICATCDMQHDEVVGDAIYLSPSGQEIAVVVGDKSQEKQEIFVGSQTGS